MEIAQILNFKMPKIKVLRLCFWTYVLKVRWIFVKKLKITQTAVKGLQKGENSSFLPDFYPLFQIQYMRFHKKYAFLENQDWLSVSKTAKVTYYSVIFPHLMP